MAGLPPPVGPLAGLLAPALDEPQVLPLAADYVPPRWARNPHVQSLLSSSGLRRHRGLQRLRQLGAVTTSHLFDGGGGVRLQGFHTGVPGMRPRGLAILLHGWEGSSESSYMRTSAASLLEQGFEVVRLNFRDHGDTHALNEGLFHSLLIDEVVQAAADAARRFPHATLVAGGYSLGGNFALRLALRAPAAGLALARVAAVCPVLDPTAALVGMETSLPVYHWYFQRKWRQSLERKRALFPQRYTFDDKVLSLGVRELTRWMVEHLTDIGSLENYLDGYDVSGERLAGLAVPADILMAQDDPVIPFEGFRHWQLPAGAHLEVARWGGHCGFIENAHCDGFGERWMSAHLAAAAA